MPIVTHSFKILLCLTLLCPTLWANSLQNDLKALRSQAEDVQVKVPEKEEWQYPPKSEKKKDSGRKRSRTVKDEISTRMAAPERKKLKKSRDKKARELLQELQREKKPDFEKIWGESSDGFRRRSR